MALALDSTFLMTIRHDYVNPLAKVDGEAAWKCVVDRFRSNKAPTVVSIVSQLARLKMSKGEGIQIFFIRAQEVYNRLQQAGEHLISTIFRELILFELHQQYKYFIVQGSFSPSEDYTYLWKRYLNCSIGKKQSLEQRASQVAKPLKSFARITRSKGTKKDGRRLVAWYVC